jgi:hypothetical protein
MVVKKDKQAVTLSLGNGANEVKLSKRITSELELVARKAWR